MENSNIIAETTDVQSVRDRDINKVISFWVRRMNSAMYDLPAARRNAQHPKGNARYQVESELAHIINDLQQDPAVMQQVHISRGNQLLDEQIQLSQQRNASKKNGKSDANDRRNARRAKRNTK